MRVDELSRLAADLRTAYMRYIGSVSAGDLARGVAYTTTDGRVFESPVGDILLHVPLHGQYHRGKVNVLFRQAGFEPVPLDFIAFARGAPAAATPVVRA